MPRFRTYQEATPLVHLAKYAKGLQCEHKPRERTGEQEQADCEKLCACVRVCD